MSGSRVVFRGPGEGNRIIPPPQAVTQRQEGSGLIKAGEADTLGAFSIFESNLQPGAPPPAPHIHALANESWYVIAGALRFVVEDEEFVAEPGSYVLVPRGLRHTLNNAGDIPARYLTFFSPPRDVLWETMTRMRQEAGDGPLDMETVQALRDQYGEGPQ